MLGRFAGVVLGMQGMRMGRMGVMGGLLVVSGSMMGGSFLMMHRGVSMVLGSLQMMLMSWMMAGSGRRSLDAVFSFGLLFCRLLCHGVSSRINN